MTSGKLRATRLLPYYSAHALGAQGNFIAPKLGLTFFFEYYGEYVAKAHPQGPNDRFWKRLDSEVPQVLSILCRRRI